MKVTSEQQAPREAVLTVDLDESDVEPYLEQAYRQAVRRLNIPGFRKGKAPRLQKLHPVGGVRGNCKSSGALNQDVLKLTEF